MRYHLNQFLAETSLKFDQLKLKLCQFYHFEAVVDHLLAQLSKDGLEEIPVHVAPYFGCVWPAPEGRFLVIDPCRWHYQHFSSAAKALGYEMRTNFVERTEAGRPIKLCTMEGSR